MDVADELAHGRLQVKRVDAGAFAEDCYTIRSALHRAA